MRVVVNSAGIVTEAAAVDPPPHPGIEVRAVLVDRDDSPVAGLRCELLGLVVTAAQRRSGAGRAATKSAPPLTTQRALRKRLDGADAGGPMA